MQQAWASQQIALNGLDADRARGCAFPAQKMQKSCEIMWRRRLASTFTSLANRFMFLVPSN